VRVSIVGAGLAGLSAARALADRGHEVTLFDKGRSVGGRLATRRIGGARVDHGAQFFTVRTDRFAAQVAAWERDGIVHEWCRGFGRSPDGHPRYAVRGGMNALAKHLARGLDVRCSSLVFGIHRGGDGGARWETRLDDASVHASDTVVVTCPLPQSFSLLVTAEVAMPEALWRTDYDRTLSLLVVLDGPGAVPPPGGVQDAAGFTFVGDNAAKGASDVPALTLHADPDWSDRHWDDPAEDAHAALLGLAAPWIGQAGVVTSQLKRWRFATPRSIWPERCWAPDDVGGLAVAGDAFDGPRVEGAFLSGLAAAERIT